VLQKLLSYIRERKLIRAGERVGIAVSGGADSVALLRAMLELREELGIVLSVVHFNHGIRGAEGDADAEFVARLAKEYTLHLHQASGVVPHFAKKWRVSTEAAARRLRYDLFRAVLAEGSVQKIATAHTRDDQAETVLLRILRGAGTRGIAGIHPVLKVEKGLIIRPMLEISRAEVEAYLKSIGQEWREDSTNADVAFSRNRVRHELLPLLERDYNPNIRKILSETAEVARDEDAFWDALVERMAKDAIETKDGVIFINLGGAAAESLAVQRRLLRRAAEDAGLQLDFHHGEEVLGLLEKNKGTEIELPDGWRAKRVGESTVALSLEEAGEPAGYSFEVTVPSETAIAPVRTLVRLTIVHRNADSGRYNPASLLDAAKLKQPLVLRNWQPGDRMRPLHRGSEEKLKRLFQEKKVPQEDRGLWPVLVSGDQVVWAKEFGVAAEFAGTDGVEAVRIDLEELPNYPTLATEARMGHEKLRTKNWNK
jgi:tRNA(Ile)-lysidine synthase